MAQKTPYISVIIPTYNRAAFIEEAVDSVLNQKNNKWTTEIIVVDDGSTDNTESLLRKYKDRINYYKIKHSGLPAVARNFGIAKAKSELIAFQDSDDLWLPDKLAIQVPLFEDAGIVMSCGHVETIEEGKIAQHRAVLTSAQLKNAEKFSELVKENSVAALTVMIRAKTLQALGGFNESGSIRAVEDYDLWLRVSAAHPNGIKTVPKILASYRVHSGNISSASDILAIERIINVYNNLWLSGLLDEDHNLILEKQLAVMQENWSRQQNIDGNTPAISVVMSMYNSEDYLREAIDSILNQTYKDFEFIIIDDGSRDKSAKIVLSYKDDRIRLIYQTNHGLVFSFNKGVQLARAKYIARMDSDDVSLPSRFKKELGWLEASGTRGLVGSYFTYVDKNTKSTGVTMVWPTKHIDIKRTMYFVNPFGHGTIMMRREAVVGVGGYRAAFEPAEDFDLWSRIAQHWEMGELPEVLYLWRYHYKNVSHTKKVIQNKSADKIVKNLWRQPVADKPIWAIFRDAHYYKNLPSPHSEQVYREYANNQSRIAAEFLEHGKLWVGYKTAFAAFFLNPKLTLGYWKTFMRPPVRYIRGKR